MMNFKQKNIILGISVFIALILSYYFAIEKTMEVKERYSTLKKEEVIYKNIPKKISEIKREEVYYDSILKHLNIGATSLQNNLLNVITSEAKKLELKVIDFNDPHVFQSKEKLPRNTFILTVEGDYVATLKLIYELEQNYSFGEIINISFKKEINYRTRKKYLRTTLMIQNIG